MTFLITLNITKKESIQKNFLFSHDIYTPSGHKIIFEGTKSQYAQNDPHLTHIQEQEIFDILKYQIYPYLQ